MDRDATRSGRSSGVPVLTWVIVLPLLVVLLFCAVTIYRQQQRLSTLRDEIHTACQGVVANLDLTEWVSLCRSAQR